MKRFILALSLCTGLLGCTGEEESLAPPAGLSGTFDLALVDRLVFVTSAETNELRVLDISGEPTEDTPLPPRDYVRAPNPLQPLSIPVLERPMALTRDVHYPLVNGVRDQEVTGPYVYARSPGSSEVSVVGADRSQLRELRRLVAPGLVTALAARGPEGAQEPSRLYLATQSASGAKVWEQELPSADALASATLAPPRLVLAMAPGELVQALLVMPEPGQLVIATRSEAGRNGRTVRLDVNAPQQATLLAFGAPVRMLATHPRVEDLPAGQLIYGVLDEGSCGALVQCRGVLAVDSATGQVARDVTGAPMLPITTGAGLPTGLTLAPYALVQTLQRKEETVTDGEPPQPRQVVTYSVAPARVPLAGIVPASNGTITFFNALERREFDFNPAEALFSVQLFDAAGTERKDAAASLLKAEIVNGATRDENYRLFFQGGLPGLGGRERAPGTSTSFEVPRDAADLVGVQAGDIVQLRDDSGACPGSQAELPILQVVPGPERTTLITAPIPSACTDVTLFSVLASGGKPFTLLSDSRGWLGRMGPGETLTLEAPYFYHPSGFDPAQPPLQVRLTLDSSVAGQLQRGERFLVSTVSGFSPFVTQADTGFGRSRYRLPSSVVAPRGPGGTDFAYIVYPSAGGILEMELKSLNVGSPSGVGVTAYE